VNVTMTGFAPGTRYGIKLSSNSTGNVQTEYATTNSSGSLTYNQLDYDEPGQTVWVSVVTPDGTVESNRITWKRP
jgi:hypothetical protein